MPLEDLRVLALESHSLQGTTSAKQASRAFQVTLFTGKLGAQQRREVVLVF